MIAVGLTGVTPMAVYASSMGVLFADACNRVLDVVSNYLRPDFPGENTDLAISVLRHMCYHRSASGAYSESQLPVGEFRNLVVGGRCSRGLSGDQCTIAVRIFDRKERLSPEECLFIRPILDPILAAAVRGVHDVWYYQRNFGVKLERDVQAMFVENRMVYLRDCVGNEESE